MSKKEEDAASVVDGTVKNVVTELISIAKNDPETKDAAKNLASTAKIVTGTLKRVVFPLAVLNYGYDKAEDYFKTRFQKDMTTLTLNIPAENVVDPKPSVAGPALQGLAYSHGEEELREMYLNLLASSMNSEIANNAHPSYVETIKQLTAKEAKLLKLYLVQDQHPISKIHLIINDKHSYETVVHHMVNLIDSRSNAPVVIEMMPAYIENWVRLGLVTVDYTVYKAAENAYDWVEKRPEYKERIVPAVDEGEFQPRLEVVKGVLARTKYGEIFGRIVGITS